jgi:hypothetical protein
LNTPEVLRPRPQAAWMSSASLGAHRLTGSPAADNKPCDMLQGLDTGTLMRRQGVRQDLMLRPSGFTKARKPMFTTVILQPMLGAARACNSSTTYPNKGGLRMMGARAEPSWSPAVHPKVRSDAPPVPRAPGIQQYTTVESHFPSPACVALIERLWMLSQSCRQVSHLCLRRMLATSEFQEPEGVLRSTEREEGPVTSCGPSSLSGLHPTSLLIQQ